VQAADALILVPSDDYAAERQRFVLVIRLARTYVVADTHSSAESRREFGIGADDCVSSNAGANDGSRRVLLSMESSGGCQERPWSDHCCTRPARV